MQSGTNLENTSIRKMKTVRKMLRAKRANDNARITHRMVDKLIRHKQSEMHVEKASLMKRMFDYAMKQRKEKKK